MTRNSHLKSTVRERMERTGQSYAEARRDLTSGRSTARTPLPRPGYEIQMDRTSTGALPYPAYLTSEGYLFNALHDYGLVIGFEVADSPTRTVALPWAEFVKDPQAAVGMVPVTRDPFTEVWSSWGTPVVTMQALSDPPAQDAERAARREEMQARHEIDSTVTLTLNDGRQWEVTRTGLVADTSGDEQPFAAVGEFVRPDGSVLPWGVFMHDPTLAVGCSVTLWDATGVRRAASLLVSKVEVY